MTGRVARLLDEADRALIPELVDRLQMVDAFADDYATRPSLRTLFARQVCAPLAQTAPDLEQSACMERVLAVLELWGASSDDSFTEICTSGQGQLVLVAEDIVAGARG